MQGAEPPRRRNAAATKAKILAAAQQAFSEIGYSTTGIRHIATQAGVDSALVQRYFGSKAGLFEAALSDAIPNFESFNPRREDFGTRLTSEFLAGFFDLRAQSMIVLATSDPEARNIAARVLQNAITPAAQWLEGPNAEARAMRLIMLATGFMLYTRQVQLMTPEAAVDNKTSAWLSRLLQEIIERPE